MRIRKSFIAFGLVLIVMAVTAVFVFLNRSPVVFPEKSGEADPLFEDLGILKVPGAPVPEDIALSDLHGKTVKLSDFKGRVVFLNFWTTWCPFCTREMPEMEKLHRKLPAEDFVMVAIGLKESAKEVEGFFKKERLTFTSLVDPGGEAGKAFAIAQIPTTLILDKNGAIIGKVIGPRSWADKEYEDFFRHLSVIPSR
ncbi:MAG: TlpA family protein disulfide reductase [Desulfobacteraceae bacterium]|nr:MAG: TlpA family protein disulfide reductase [Desulfobacteraceae bacterium]